MLLDRQLFERTRARGERPPVTVVVGGCGAGRTERLRRVERDLGVEHAQYIDVERVATTPERCYDAVRRATAFTGGPADPPAGAREAFDALLAFLMSARGRDGGPATFLLDEVLDVRTFESFPGLRAAQAELARAIAHSPNTFVLASRFEARARRFAGVEPARFDVVRVEPLTTEAVLETLGVGASADAQDLAETVGLLADGHAGYVRALASQLAQLRSSGATDAISAFAAAMAPDGELAARCRFSYELRLHRARGYGALKAILEVLAVDEPLTLTGIAQRLDRTPGSTKDYLTWLQDVDLVACDRKRYRFADPLLRLWVRINYGPRVPDEDRVISEVQVYALARLRNAAPRPAYAPVPVPAPALAVASSGDTYERPRAIDSGIIEID
jgi:hypothetical protein